MFVNSPSGASSYWYDRSPSIPAISYVATGVAPHSSTQRWSYTVPSGRSAYLSGLSSQTARSSTPTTAGLAIVTVDYTPSGGSAAAVLATAVDTANDTLSEHNHTGAGGIMLAGDSLVATTSDASTGGTQCYSVIYAGGEFNA